MSKIFKFEESEKTEYESFDFDKDLYSGMIIKTDYGDALIINHTQGLCIIDLKNPKYCTLLPKENIKYFIEFEFGAINYIKELDCFKLLNKNKVLWQSCGLRKC